MKEFILKSLLFICFGCFIGEGIIRVFNLGVDIPKMYVDSSNLIKNKPLQTGYYVNGNKWEINKYGEFGYEPKTLDTLITVIGDSYIENIMNPTECHQAYFLSKIVNGYDFYPSARSGASLIEFFEISKSLNHLRPIKELFYVHDDDFFESVLEIEKETKTVQLSIESNQIIYPFYSQNKLKEFLYNFKFFYYLYRNYFNDTQTQINHTEKQIDIEKYNKIQSLYNFINENYQTDNIILVFSPNSDINLVELAKKNKFQTLVLKTKNINKWQFSHDAHWTCFGHSEVSKQVGSFLNMILENN